MRNYIVSDSEIKKAEKDIFENKYHFNSEQKEFIKYLDSCCLQAYAGTGKTSTIVGKLHVLAQKDVWKSGRGICVLSHTNVAVDEIRKHVAIHYPAIMEYPNFIGTIQEFVNKFLFAPYLARKGMRMQFQDETYNYKPDWQSLNILDAKIKKVILQFTAIFNKSTNEESIFDQIYLNMNTPCFSGKYFPLEAINKRRKKRSSWRPLREVGRRRHC